MNNFSSLLKYQTRCFSSKFFDDDEGSDFSDFETNAPSPSAQKFQKTLEKASTKSLLTKDLEKRLKDHMPPEFKESKLANPKSEADLISGLMETESNLKALVSRMERTGKAREEDFSDFEDGQTQRTTIDHSPEAQQNDFYSQEETVPHESTVYLTTSDTVFPDEEYKSKFEKEQKEQEARFGDYSDNLVRRPKKGFLWGLGSKTFQESESEYFEIGKLPTIRQIIRFLEVHQTKDIKAVNLCNVKATHLTKFAVLGSCFSSKHLYHVSKTLASEVKKLN